MNGEVWQRVAKAKAKKKKNCMFTQIRNQRTGKRAYNVNEKKKNRNNRKRHIKHQTKIRRKKKVKSNGIKYTDKKIKIKQNIKSLQRQSKINY